MGQQEQFECLTGQAKVRCWTCTRSGGKGCILVLASRIGEADGGIWYVCRDRRGKFGGGHHRRKDSGCKSCRAAVMLLEWDQEPSFDDCPRITRRER